MNNPLILFLHITSLIFIYYVLAIISVEIIDRLEFYFVPQNKPENIKKISTFILLVEIVIRLSMNMFIIQYLPNWLMYVNKIALNNIFSEDLVIKTAYIFSMISAVFDSNLLIKVDELKLRVDNML
jgi:hypothetical protein